MKQKIGIGLLIALNLTFISVIIFQTRLSFALIVAPLGEEMGKEVANQLSFEFLIKFAAIALLVFLFNYLLFNKMVSNTRPLISSIIISIIGVFVFIPLLISEKQSFINYQNGTTALRHYLKKDKITEALVVISTDSIKVVKLDNFIRDIGYAKYKRGLWKYQKKMKIILKNTDDSKDTIATNGLIFGPYKGKFFEMDKNLIVKFLIN